MRDFLSSEVRTELEIRHDSERDGRIRDRIKAILLADKGWSYQDIAEALRMGESSVGRFIKEYLHHHKLKPLNGGSSSKINEFQAGEIKHHLNHVIYMKVSAICEYVRRTYGISYTVSGMTKWFHHEVASPKRIQF